MQNKRINNMIRDESKLFLIAYEIDKKHRHTFTVCNMNDETKPCFVKLEPDDAIVCSCADYRFRCYKNNIICKHCIFILKKCMGFEVETLVVGRKISNINQVLDKLNDIQIVKRNTNTTFTRNEKEMDPDDICPICMDNIGNGEETVSCPTCKNYVHKICINAWMRMQKTCVYCRSDVWKLFNNHNIV